MNNRQRRPSLPEPGMSDATIVKRVLQMYPHAHISSATAITRPSLRKWHETFALPSPPYLRALLDYYHSQTR